MEHAGELPSPGPEGPRQPFRLIPGSERHHYAAANQPEGLRQGSDSARRRAVIVLGMHRSGTSILTAMICMAGADAPLHLIPASEDHATGYWEPAGFAQAHDDLFNEMGTAWDDPSACPVGYLLSPKAVPHRIRLAEKLREEYSNSHLFCLKDPRMARLMPLWVPLLQSEGIEASYVIVARNPLEVAANLKRHNGFEQSKSMMLWLRHTLEAELYTRGKIRAFVTYDQLIADWRGTLRAVGQKLGVSWPRREAAIAVDFERILSPSLRQHQASLSELEAKTEIPQWICDIYRACISASEGRDENTLDTFDRVRSELECADKAFEPLLLQSVLERQKAIVEHSEMPDRVNGIVNGAESVGSRADMMKSGEGVNDDATTLNRLEEGVTRLRADLVAAQTLNQQLKTRNADMDAHISHLEHSEIALRDEISAQEAMLCHLKARMSQLETANRNLQHANGVADDLRKQLGIDLEEACRQLEFERVTRSALEKSASARDAFSQQLELQAEIERETREKLEFRILELEDQLERQCSKLLDLQARSVNAVGTAYAMVAEAEEDWFILFAELEATRQRFQHESAELSARSVLVKQLERRIRDSDAEALRQVTDLRRQFDGLKIEYARLKDTWQKTKVALSDERQRSESLAAQLAVVRTREANYEVRLADLETQVSGGAEYVSILLAQIAEKSRAVEEAACRVQQIDAELDATRNAAISQQLVLQDYMKSLQHQAAEIPQLRDAQQQLVAQAEELIASAQAEGAHLVALIDAVQTSHFWKMKRFLRRVSARVPRR